MRHIGLIIPDIVSAAAETLENMTVQQLREYAVEHGIDLGAAKSKADIITIINAVTE